MARDLRAANLNIEMLSPERKMKTLLARASKIGARFAVIIGDDELARGVVQLRDLKQSTQREVAERRQRVQSRDRTSGRRPARSDSCAAGTVLLMFRNLHRY